MSEPLPLAGRRRIVAILAVLPWPLVLFQFLLIVPRYARLFRDIRLQVPPATTLLIDISTWARSHTLPAFAMASVLTFASVIVAQTVQSIPLSRTRRGLILLVVFGLPCLVFALTWLGVWSTHRTLVEGLNR